MRVEVTERTLKSDGYTLVEGDTITVPDEVGQMWCAAGWGKDTSGTVETGPRVVLDASLVVQNSRLAVASEEVSHG